MKYVSSRNKELSLPPSQALIQGLAADGGLFTPVLEGNTIDLNKLSADDYRQLAIEILAFFLTDFNREELKECVTKAYDNKFDNEELTPLRKISDAYLLELWHGPTSAFKDMALTLLPHLLKAAYQKNSFSKTLAILTATSGDTGKAALSAFADVEKTAITVLYPEIGVSEIQKLQMITSPGNNVKVLAVKGNFDECQRLVKQASGDKNILNGLDNIIISSANSINIGRLIPQVVYYYYAYLKLLKDHEIEPGEKISFCVPTGNFGDILAGYLAKESGLPIEKLICASNSNNVLYDFIKTGRYDLQRDFINTISPSMDILISSNLERLLYLLSQDDQKVKGYMQKLQDQGSYQIDDRLLQKIQASFAAGWTSESECKETIKELFQQEKVLIDPHTAVALYVARKQASPAKTVVLSTASPYKFASDVLAVFGIEESDPFKAINILEDMSAVKAPTNLTGLKDLPIRFTETIEIKDGLQAIRERLQEINDA